jgi:hypothetical protein
MIKTSGVIFTDCQVKNLRFGPKGKTSMKTKYSQDDIRYVSREYKLISRIFGISRYFQRCCCGKTNLKTDENITFNMFNASLYIKA